MTDKHHAPNKQSGSGHKVQPNLGQKEAALAKKSRTELAHMEDEDIQASAKRDAKKHER